MWFNLYPEDACLSPVTQKNNGELFIVTVQLAIDNSPEHPLRDKYRNAKNANKYSAKNAKLN